MSDESNSESGITAYALRISDAEVERYQLMARRAVRAEAEVWAECGIGPGARIVDLGCGPGAVSVEMARLVGAAGAVVGVDQDAPSLAAAEELGRRAGVGNVEWVHADAADTGLPSGFDVVMVRHVLVHAGSQINAIIGHAIALLRPGGCLYVMDGDAAALRFDPVDVDFADLYARYAEFHARAGKALALGPQLGSILRAAGLEVIHRHGGYEVVSPVLGGGGPWAARDAMVAAGMATPDDLARWQRAIERVAADPGSALFAPRFAAAGRKAASA
ncbi:methyltransferase domain-containing protein [Frankia sp. AgB32]|uniref:methyltransferase domain-containing protein n=1 Tax=Frankia sp. AgB32 TaxID=631119 RepID=UPI00200D9BC2|nr:methyltransferase domain-containing protein [Frankia sp. AgB32]MCK9897965.1 methyltransferase domain-containing protein [Frankia sp. AgB32]